MSGDPFALLLDEESDDQREEEKDIPCLHIQNDEIHVTINDSLFEDDECTEKIRILLKYLQKDKDLNANKYKTFDFTIDLTEKELEIQENNPLYGLKYVLELSKKYITSLSMYITAYRDKRQLPFNNMPPALDNDVILSIFETIRESVCNYRLHYINLQWIPVNSCNYSQFTNGIVDILNIKPNEIRQKPILIPMDILFSSEWLGFLSSNHNEKGQVLIDAIADCKICKDLTLHFDKSADWLTFDKNSLKSMASIFNSIGNNAYIESLSIFGIPFGVVVVVDALAKCLENKTLPRGKEDFSLSLSFDAQAHSLNMRAYEKDDLHLLLDALYENDNICLNELCLYRNGANWDINSINLICDLMESDQHRITNLVLEGDFVSKYSFGMYKVVGFDKLVNCLINKQQMKDQEVKRINIGTILDDGDSDIYNEYVIQLIEECNIWLTSITIKYEKFTSNFTEISEAFFNRLQIVYKTLQIIRKELFAIFDMVDVVNLIVDLCKIECFEIFIVDYGDADIKKTDLITERSEFRNCLYDFFAKIQFEVTKNRKEFHRFTQEISTNTVGIWIYPFKSPEHCVSVIL